VVGFLQDGSLWVALIRRRVGRATTSSLAAPAGAASEEVPFFDCIWVMLVCCRPTVNYRRPAHYIALKKIDSIENKRPSFCGAERGG